MLTLIASAAGDPTVQQVLIEKGALDLTVALLSERHQRSKEQHERVTLAGVYVLDRFVASGFAAGRVQTAGGVNLVLKALKMRKPAIELRFVACRCS